MVSAAAGPAARGDARWRMAPGKALWVQHPLCPPCNAPSVAVWGRQKLSGPELTPQPRPVLLPLLSRGLGYTGLVLLAGLQTPLCPSSAGYPPGPQELPTAAARGAGRRQGWRAELLVQDRAPVPA